MSYEHLVPLAYLLRVLVSARLEAMETATDNPLDSDASLRANMVVGERQHRPASMTAHAHSTTNLPP